MKSIRIIFDENHFTLPDGFIVGVQGEHNAVRLVITLPDSMIENISYHVVTIGGVVSARITDEAGNVDGAIRIGNTIYQPLTAAYTSKRIVDVSVTAYRQASNEVQLVDKTPTVYGLRFYAGQPHKMVGGIVAEVAQLKNEVDAIREDLPSSSDVESWNKASEASHSHENRHALDAVTDEKIEGWDEAAADKHSHENKASLDKLFASAFYSGLPANAPDGAVAVVTDVDRIDKPLSQYDAQTDAGVLLSVAQELTYDATAQIDDAVLVVDTDNDDVSATILPVYSPDADSKPVGMIGMRLVTDKTDAKKYMIVVAGDISDSDVLDVLEEVGVSVSAEAEVVMLVYLYSFEDVTGIIESEDDEEEDEDEEDDVVVSAHQGWNVFYIIADGSDAIIGIEPIADPNRYLNLGVFGSIRTAAPQHPFLYDVFRLERVSDKRGVYGKAGGQWTRFYDGELNALTTGLSAVEDAAHTHANQAALDRIGGTEASLVYNGKTVQLIEPDDVTPLGFGTYSDLVIRDEVTEAGGIQDVPVYTGETSLICKLWYNDGLHMHTDGDYIALMETRQEIDDVTSGMPVRYISVKLAGVTYTYLGAELHRNGSIVPAGWYNGSEPTIVDFTANAFRVNGVDYDDLSVLPDDAKSALRSLSQCINVSAEAMGAISVSDDAVERFAGIITPNRKYYFEAVEGSEISFTLPVVPWDVHDAQFVIYLTCADYVDLIFPQGTLFVGDVPNSDAGEHKLIGCWLRDVGLWAIGSVDYEAVTS